MRAKHNQGLSSQDLELMFRHRYREQPSTPQWRVPAGAIDDLLEFGAGVFPPDVYAPIYRV
jgi:hypothetical protein